MKEYYLDLKTFMGAWYIPQNLCDSLINYFEYNKDYTKKGACGGKTDAIINNKPLNIYNFGNLSRSFTFIDDVVEIIISLIYKPAFSDKLFKTDQPNTSSS